MHETTQLIPAACGGQGGVEIAGGNIYGGHRQGAQWLGDAARYPDHAQHQQNQRDARGNSCLGQVFPQWRQHLVFRVVDAKRP